ncbi:hypothetical protein [Novosphingobium gossypii]|uniref:hypothetical protein n=1 Tax=Novosphingobium gossypii TaxID=1604774 RepID=UPI003D1DED11
MTIVRDIEKLVTRLAPSPVCDECLADTLGLSVLHHADQAARQLAGMNGFERRKDTCGLCGEVRMVSAKR